MDRSIFEKTTLAISERISWEGEEWTQEGQLEGSLGSSMLTWDTGSI